jgi:hypothetical protein
MIRLFLRNLCRRRVFSFPGRLRFSPEVGKVNPLAALVRVFFQRRGLIQRFFQTSEGAGERDAVLSEGMGLA